MAPLLSYISPHGAKGPLRSNAALLSIFAVGGGAWWFLRSRSAAREEEKQAMIRDKLDKNPHSDMGRSITGGRNPYTR